MASHIFTLAVIQLVRCLIGLGVGSFLVYRSVEIPLARLARLEPMDQKIFLVGGIIGLALALLRGIHASLVLWRVLRANSGGFGTGFLGGRQLRHLGLLIALVDILDIVVFPLSTACGLYGFLVYRNPESVDFFEGIFSDEIAADSSRSRVSG